VIGYAAARIGLHYDMKNVVDLARCLLRRSRCRPAAILGANDPQRVICSSLIAQAFASVGFAVLPELGVEDRQTHAPRLQKGLLRLPRHHSRISPRDFDISPNFGVIKPAVRHAAARETTPVAPFAFGDAAAIPAS
jgi:hypothetical protein